MHLFFFERALILQATYDVDFTQDGRAVFPDGSEECIDAVIYCTGKTLNDTHKHTYTSIFYCSSVLRQANKMLG